MTYSGYLGDCGNYHGWVVGVDINNPANVHGWATTAMGGGIWGHSGVASDGTNMFVITGNTFNTGGNWMGGEAIIRLQAGPTWTGQPTDYWAPVNWFSLDNSDTDLGGVSAMLIDVPGATPSQLVLALGKDGNAYLLNRNNLGGIAAPIAQLSVDSVIRGQSSATYRTSQGTYFVFRASNQIKAYKITATSPPTIVTAWAVTQNGQGSPWVTTTDGTNNAIVWVVGAQGDGQLHGYDGDTGAVIYAGTDVMSGTRKWNSGMAARGSIYVANDNKVMRSAFPEERLPLVLRHRLHLPRPLQLLLRLRPRQRQLPLQHLHRRPSQRPRQLRPQLPQQLRVRQRHPGPTPSPRSRARPRPRPTPAPRPTL